jgi:hypothetical protein
MRRAGWLIGFAATVALVGAAVASGPPSAEPVIVSTPTPAGDSTVPEQRLAARLGYRGPDGHFIPISDAIVLVGFSDVGCKEPFQSPTKVSFEEDGGFSIPIVLQYSTARVRDFKPDGSASEPYCIEGQSYGCYRFKARGCDDLVLRYDPQQRVPELLEMRCRSRARSR